VPKTSTDDQPIPLPGTTRQGLEEAAPRDAPGTASKTGVVLVHGIGTQQPSETFLDWSGPIVTLLTEWRRGLEATGAGDGTGDAILDPVRRGAFTFNAASPPYLEIAVPAHAGLPATSWIITEAWWAADLRPPDLGRTIGYLRRRLRTIVGGISAGYRGRTDNLVEMAREQGVLEDGPPPAAWRAIDQLDRIQSQVFGARPIGWTIGLIGTGLLAGYDLLRRVPIGPVRDFAARKMIDSFLVDWFGDLPVLNDDPVQSANVRARLAGSIRGLREQGCDAVVVVAHSGGALVSFETLLDPAYLGPDYRVDKLVTLGQGLGLAWRLAADPTIREIAPGHRLVGNLARARPELRWVDFWATYDPAPAGPLPARGGVVTRAAEEAGPPQVAAVVETGEGESGEAWLVRADVGTRDDVRTAAADQAKAAEIAVRGATPSGAGGSGRRRGAAVPPVDPPTIQVESRPLTNEMNVMTDHGGYWANDEGFLVPLVRHIDAATGPAEVSRFYRDRRSRTLRIVWRLQRVAALAAWDWLCSLAAGLSVAILLIADLRGDRRLPTAGDAVAAAWTYIPGHEIVSGPIDGIGGLLQAMANALGRPGAVDWLAAIGPSLLGVASVFGLYYAVARVGHWRWHDWDRRERVLFRPETPTPPDRRRTAAQAILLVGGLGAVFLAILTGSERLTFAVWTVAAVAGLLRWAASSSVPADGPPA
jgi:hypothetical protein